MSATPPAKRSAELPPGVRADGKLRKDLGRKTLQLNHKPGATKEDVRREVAALATSSELNAYRVVAAAERKSGLGDSIDVPTLLEILRSQANAANRNDLTQAEAMLMNQATALQSLFGRLAELGLNCSDLSAFEAHMRVALRAQAQCRATLETLAALKNPPVVFARQAYIAAGPQQVNNAAAADPSRARESEIVPSKLLETDYGQRLDIGATSATGGADPRLAAVDAVHRSEDASGEG